MNPPRIPRATYRLQLHRGFGFRQATAIVPYLHALGISHIYCSPYLRARAGSHHGYDIVDHNSINPELGGQEAFLDFVSTLNQHGMGQILDLVPNHMGIGGDDNPWWLDVLENGPSSSYAEYFDIDWQPVKPELAARVLLPFLEDHYGKVLEAGLLTLRFDAEHGTFSIHYHEHRFPLDPRSYLQVLAIAVEALATGAGPDHSHVRAARELLTLLEALPPRWQLSPDARRKRARDKEIAKQQLTALCAVSPALRQSIKEAVLQLNGEPERPGRFDALHELLEQQAYRLAYWRVAADEINYRRFFDINSLAALRMELPDVYAATHRRVLAMIGNGQLHGLRIDHPDGLFDPAAYYARLEQSVAEALHVPDPLPVYTVAEKILSRDETLPRDWRIHGTSGYEFASLVNGLYVHPDGERPLTRLYAAVAGPTPDFADIVYNCKKLVMRTLLAGELQVLAGLLDRLSEADRNTRDYTLPTLRSALQEYIACLPVYRTYLTADGSSDKDRKYMASALKEARRRSPADEDTVFHFLAQLLLREEQTEPLRQDWLQFVMKLQQFTAPVMAKGLEDTSLYCYHRLVSLNDVGCDPRRFGVAVAEFHEVTRERAAAWPHSLLTTSTHDSKRSEDVRARLNVLSECPEDWQEHVRRWTRRHRRLKRDVEDNLAPSANDEYLLYQTLVGMWPPGEFEPAGLVALRQRVTDYMRKAVREAKQHSSWLQPHVEYEAALDEFIAELLKAPPGNSFLDDFLPFQRRIAQLGMLNSLSQTLIKLTAPGVPDLYQGNELWEFSLVDPDNRQPVDFDSRATLLDALCQKGAPDLHALTAHLANGRAKLYLTWRALQFRAAEPELFSNGDYRPLQVTGAHADKVCAFARTGPTTHAVTIAPRWFSRLMPESDQAIPDSAAWQDTRVEVPPSSLTAVNFLSGQSHAAIVEDGRHWISLREVLSDFPVALLQFVATPP